VKNKEERIFPWHEWEAICFAACRKKATACGQKNPLHGSEMLQVII
jgi:hypothetical protein